jgi:hypothetical protein
MIPTILLIDKIFRHSNCVLKVILHKYRLKNFTIHHSNKKIISSMSYVLWFYLF